MNVEYRCPDCGGRLFAPPGGTKLHCPRHQESIYIEVEEYHGPDFLNVDEEGRTKSKDVILPGNTRQSKEAEHPVEVPADVELGLYRAMYEDLTGEQVDKRWSVATIKEQLTNQFLRVPEVAEVSDSDAGGTNDPPTEPTEPGVEVPDIPPGDDEDDDEGSGENEYLTDELDGSEIMPGPDSPGLILVPNQESEGNR